MIQRLRMEGQSRRSRSREYLSPRGRPSHAGAGPASGKGSSLVPGDVVTRDSASCRSYDGGIMSGTDADRYAETLRASGLGSEDLMAWQASGLPSKAFNGWLTDRVAHCCATSQCITTMAGSSSPHGPAHC